MKRLLDFYLVSSKLAMMQQFQYRLQSVLYMVWLVIEPVIYLVVWSTIARSNGGSVDGYTAGGFAAYYIVWMLVRQMNMVRAPADWEWRIQHGSMAAELMRPIHPIHNDISDFAGSKVFMILIWLPVAALLSLIFKPVIHTTWLQVLVFIRVGAIFDLYFALELILSGRLVPMPLMPAWVQHLANFLPFQSMFYFPINALIGTLTPLQLFAGLAMQLLWFLGALGLVNLVWHFAIRRFSSVGN
jgi:ABC-2 type transport system permease protein